MKLIFSRKGFDSSSGGCANPILPDGSLCPLPIPDLHAPYRYEQFPQLSALAFDLSRGRVRPEQGAHLDPDLEENMLPRHPQWRPLFGQHGAAAGHLARQSVSDGDVFLYFGWFRQVEQEAGCWVYHKDAPDLHVLFGWLQIDRVLALEEDVPRTLEWVKYHPHFFGPRAINNTLYVARRRLALPSFSCELPGAGQFPLLRTNLILTRQGERRGVWQVPTWMHPEGRDTALTYHQRRERWQQDGDSLALKSVHRGQEFVLDMDHYPESLPWLADLLTQMSATT